MCENMSSNVTLDQCGCGHGDKCRCLHERRSPFTMTLFQSAHGQVGDLMHAYTNYVHCRVGGSSSRAGGGAPVEGALQGGRRGSSRGCTAGREEGLQ